MVSQSDFDSNSSNSSNSNSNSIDEDEDLFSHAAHVLATEAAALASITALYRTSPTAKKNLKSAVETILQSQQSRGKLIVSGVGKSAYIAQKLVATCKSMGVATSFMHACEAAHGDLGDVRDVRLKINPSFTNEISVLTPPRFRTTQSSSYPTRARRPNSSTSSRTSPPQPRS
jgi:hypothetical protein